jgi:anaerobic selenocysteine-containing dehydrogenase
MAVATRKSYCRICTAYCALEVDVEGGRVRAVRGDPGDPVSGGYTCIKGRQLPHQMYGPGRLWHAQRRAADGGFAPIATARALDEIAVRVRDVIARHGPRAVATYSGTAAYANSVALPVVRAWHAGIGSPSNYSTLTIDQPAKIIAAVRHGVWGGGGHTFAGADVALSIGNNPVVSSLTLPGGPPGTNPVRSVMDARRRGLKLICVDPRRSELARRADLHLQIQPGEDAALLAGMLRVILHEERHDAAFCAAHTDGLAALAAALAPFTPDAVARRTRVPAAQMVAAARTFAAGPRGYASSGTGPDMGPHACLTEHLIASLNTLCGRHNRAGERLPNPGVLSPPGPRPAQAIPAELLPPILSYGTGPASRVRGLRRMFDEMPTTTLADEILAPGDGQIRALIVVGGNPAVAVPDQRAMVRALDDLELMVCVDLTMTETARRADYVLAARHALERDDVTEFMDMFYEVPYAHYAAAVAAPEGDTIDDWEVFTGLAHRMGTAIELAGGAVDVAHPPSKLEIMRLIRPATRVPLETIRDADGGRVFDELADVRVDPPLAGVDARLHFAPAGICEELAALHAEPWEAVDTVHPYRLICRRLGHVINSVGQTFPGSRAKGRTNPAYMHPDDLAALGLVPGDVVEIASAHDAIVGVVAASDELQPGVVSMAHCWGAAPDAEVDVRQAGSTTSRLVATDRDYDPITGMARQTAIPVRVRRAGAAA